MNLAVVFFFLVICVSAAAVLSPPRATGFQADTFCSWANSSSANLTRISSDGVYRQVSIEGIVATEKPDYNYDTDVWTESDTTFVEVEINRPRLMIQPGCHPGNWRSGYSLNLTVPEETDELEVIHNMTENYQGGIISRETLELTENSSR